MEEIFISYDFLLWDSWRADLPFTWHGANSSVLPCGQTGPVRGRLEHLGSMAVRWEELQTGPTPLPNMERCERQLGVKVTLPELQEDPWLRSRSSPHNHHFSSLNTSISCEARPNSDWALCRGSRLSPSSHPFIHPAPAKQISTSIFSCKHYLLSYLCSFQINYHDTIMRNNNNSYLIQIWWWFSRTCFNREIIKIAFIF